MKSVIGVIGQQTYLFRYCYPVLALNMVDDVDWHEGDWHDGFAVGNAFYKWITWVKWV